MIYDKIENIDLYKLDKNAVEFIKNLTPDIECKKHIITENVYANIEEYKTKEQGFFEAHKDYIDIQILLSGEEIIEYTPLDGLKIKEDYNPFRDIAFYFDGTNPVLPIKLIPGFFSVLYPNDAHKPQIISSSSQIVKKVIVKIKIG